jgi:uncharacterized protein (TIGR03118 family)
MHIRFLLARPRLLALVLTIGMLLPLTLPGTATAATSQTGAAFYQQTNLVSDIPGLAAFTDRHLVNPWGISFSSTSPFWISDNGTGVSTLYNGQGQPFPPPPRGPLVVTIPPAPGSGQGTPTGTVFNGTTGFVITQGTSSHPALFLFDTLDGTLSGWNPAVNASSAVIAVNNAGSAVYTGLAMASNASGTFLYAANALPSPAHPNGTIDVFDQHFTPTQLQGSFTDPNLPADYSVYNIQTVAGLLLVTYALPPTSPSQVGDGFVDAFDTNGHLIRRLISRGPLDAPWGLVLAPAGFGRFSKALLVGNLANGYINAFDFETGAFRGTLESQLGQPIQNAGLWALTFGTGSQGFNPETLYFDAGIDNFQHGLFGAITPDS